MPLHPIKLPPAAQELRRIVAMQRLLLKALCQPSIDPDSIDMAWLENVWKTQSEEWIKRFCRTRRRFSVLDKIRAIAGTPVAARKSLFQTFCEQHRVKQVFERGGSFAQLQSINGITPAQASDIGALFKRFYEFLSHDSHAKWDGYEFPRRRRVSKQSLQDQFKEANWDTLRVCPYCDGANEIPVLDHYYPKGFFEILSCSPWNLVPVCDNCNKIGSKGSNIPLNSGAPNPANAWLHPYFRPASSHVTIELSGNLRDWVPRLHSENVIEQSRLNNHTDSLIQNLCNRWTNCIASYHDILITRINRKMGQGKMTDDVVNECLDDYNESKGKESNALLKAAVCRAILNNRPGYRAEILDPNPVELS